LPYLFATEITGNSSRFLKPKGSDKSLFVDGSIQCLGVTAAVLDGCMFNNKMKTCQTTDKISTEETRLTYWKEQWYVKNYVVARIAIHLRNTNLLVIRISVIERNSHVLNCSIYIFGNFRANRFKQTSQPLCSLIEGALIENVKISICFSQIKTTGVLIKPKHFSKKNGKNTYSY